MTKCLFQLLQQERQLSIFVLFFVLKQLCLNKQPEIYIIYIQIAPDNLNESYTLCVWAEQALLGSSKTALKLKYEI